MDELAPRQCLERRIECRRRQNHAQIDVMDIVHEFDRIDAMLDHQAAQRRAVALEERAPELGRRLGIELEPGRDVRAHARRDLREEIGRGRIERVVEIENPGVDLLRNQWHG